MGQQEIINELILKINQAFKADSFPNFIQYIRFPSFKNLADNSIINFDFPFTVLTGLNGSGKSSALHAIYGCPEGYSTGQYWFATKVDPIVDERGSPPAFVYGYKLGSDIVEVLKTRIGTAKGADYWEPSRPLKKYGMTTLVGGKRNPTIKKNVVYLDFRSELSAFDKYFYFAKFKATKTLKSKQDVLRKYSWHVKFSLDANLKTTVGIRKSNAPIKLSKDSITSISKILGKTYDECKILLHDLYGTDGATIYFKNGILQYSEAFAGRGEFAVVKLVYELENAPKGSLVILDEPEVSLHPGAQQQLKIFLLEKTLEKKLQIVISSHSPKLVEFLPDNSIKLFFLGSNNKFSINNKCSYHEAFSQIGESISKDHKKVIVVEDSLGKNIIDAILKDIGGDYPLLFDVAYFPGGAEDIYKSSVLYSQEGEVNKYIILDGDKKKSQLDSSKFSIEESNDLSFLTQKLKDITNSDLKKLGFKIDGNADGGNEDQKEAIINYIEYNNNNLAYLPLNTPEEFIWDEDYANNLLAVDGNKMPKIENDYKKKFEKFSELFYQASTGKEIFMAQKKFIQNFVKKKDDNYKAITKILEKFHD